MCRIRLSFPKLAINRDLMIGGRLAKRVIHPIGRILFPNSQIITKIGKQLAQSPSCIVVEEGFTPQTGLSQPLRVCSMKIKYHFVKRSLFLISNLDHHLYGFSTVCPSCGAERRLFRTVHQRYMQR
jgi:hypothetical protein